MLPEKKQTHGRVKRSDCIEIDGWLHRTRIINGEPYLVPMNLNRVEAKEDSGNYSGWQIRFYRVDEKIHSSFYSDNKLGGIDASFEAACNELHRLRKYYRHISELSLLQSVDSINKRIKLGVSGIGISIVKTQMTPMIRIQASMVGKHGKNYKTTLNQSVFSLTTNVIINALDKSVAYRRYWESLYRGNKSISGAVTRKDILPFMFEKYTRPTLLQILEASYTKEELQLRIDINRISFDQQRAFGDSIFTVSRKNPLKHYAKELKVFNSKVIGSELAARSLAVLYANTLQSREPLTNNGWKKTKGAMTCKSTGVKNVSFMKHNGNLYFFAYHKDEDGKRKKTAYSTKKMGFEAAFNEAYLHATEELGQHATMTEVAQIFEIAKARIVKNYGSIPC